MCCIYGWNGVFTCQLWFREFKNGDRDISNRTHAGRRHTPNEEILKAIRELDLRQSTRGWRQNINVSCSAVHQYSQANYKRNNLPKKEFHSFFSSGVLSSESNKSFNQECQPPLILSLLYLQMMKSEFWISTKSVKDNGYHKIRHQCHQQIQDCIHRSCRFVCWNMKCIAMTSSSNMEWPALSFFIASNLIQ